MRLLARVRYLQRLISDAAARVSSADVVETAGSGGASDSHAPASLDVARCSAPRCLTPHCPAGDLTLGVASVLLLVAGAVVVVPFVLLGRPEFGAPPDMPLAEPVAPGEP